MAGTNPPQAMPKIAAALMSKKRMTSLQEIGISSRKCCADGSISL